MKWDKSSDHKGHLDSKANLNKIKNQHICMLQEQTI